MSTLLNYAVKTWAAGNFISTGLTASLDLQSPQMILSKHTTDAAFKQLITTLDAEVKELNEIGSKVAIFGDSKNARRVMSLAAERAKLRDHIKFLHTQWAQDEPEGIDQLQVQLPELPGATSFQDTIRSSKIKGMTLGAAAKKLGVSEAKIRTWLEAGTLKGYRRSAGGWKITQADIADFYRGHRELL